MTHNIDNLNDHIDPKAGMVMWALTGNGDRIYAHKSAVDPGFYAVFKNRISKMYKSPELAIASLARDNGLTIPGTTIEVVKVVTCPRCARKTPMPAKPRKFTPARYCVCGNGLKA